MLSTTRFTVHVLPFVDGVSYTKLNSFDIYVGNDTSANSENNLICHIQYSTYVSRGALEEFQCTDGPLVGRYVIISLRDAGGQRYLTLCEIIVKGFEFKGMTCTLYLLQHVQLPRAKKWQCCPRATSSFVVLSAENPFLIF